MQVRGGRGYETAASLKARGEKPVPVEQAHARHADQPDLRGLDRDHAPADRARGGRHSTSRSPATCSSRRRRLKRQGASRGARPARSTRKWLPQLAVGKGQVPSSYERVRPAGAHLRFVERSSRKLARSTFYGMTRWQAELENRQAFLGRIVDIGAELFAISAAVRLRRDDRSRAPGARRARPSSSPSCSAARPAAASSSCSPSCGPTTTTPTTAAAQQRARRALPLARGGHPRPLGRGPDDRPAARARGDALGLSQAG